MTIDQGAYDVVIIGAGPSGLACAIEAQKNNLRYTVIDKGCLVDSLFHFPKNLIFFSTPELLEIGDVPFVISSDKPTRNDLLKYYRRVASHFELNLKLYEEVRDVVRNESGFQIETSRGSYVAKAVILATGQFEMPRKLGVPGEGLEKVQHYFFEGHSHYHQKVAVIGGKNSAVEAALELYRCEAEVVLIHRGDDFGKSVKYWILPDIQNRIREGKIQAYFNTVVKKIDSDHIEVEQEGKRFRIANDVVYALIGYRPDCDFLKQIGLKFDANDAPLHNPKTLETEIPALYIAGVLTAGSEGTKVFIENTRHHGSQIIGHILNGSK